MRSSTTITAWLFSLILLTSLGCGRDAADAVCSETDPCPGEQVCVEGACFDDSDIQEDVGVTDVDDEDAIADVIEFDAGGPDSVDQPDIIEVACEGDRDCPASQSCVEEVCVDRPEDRKSTRLNSSHVR